jgi:broad specificity phosphatase PhoE
MTIFFVTHPDVLIDPAVPVPQWSLSARGRARMEASVSLPWTREIRHIVASTERKAIEAAGILAAGRGITFATREDLGENDRSATGYLPRDAFERMADAFFAAPQESIRGWERAIDAQRRIVAAFFAVTAFTRDAHDAKDAGDTAIVSHGAVGALLLCALTDTPISRSADQPPGAGGFFLTIEPATHTLRHGWRAIDLPQP